ncbi:MAG: NAD(P)-dependent dehydrogenase (short-subunit alcohol dehydrogenase family) [Myxococcota bacterium]
MTNIQTKHLSSVIENHTQDMTGKVVAVTGTTSGTDGRVVSHTSMARLGGPQEAQYFAKTGGDLGGDGTEEENASFQGPRWARYHQSKLANCTFTFELKAQLESHGISNVKAMIAHPGLASTSLQVTTAETGGMDLDGGLMSNAQSAEDGALGIIRACADPEGSSSPDGGDGTMPWGTPMGRRRMPVPGA